MVGGQNNMGVVMKELIADPQTTDAKKMPDFIQKVIKLSDRPKRHLKKGQKSTLSDSPHIHLYQSL